MLHIYSLHLLCTVSKKCILLVDWFLIFACAEHTSLMMSNVAYGQNESVILQKVDIHVQITQKQTKSYYTEADIFFAITPVSLLPADTNKQPLIQNMPLNSWETGLYL